VGNEDPERETVVRLREEVNLQPSRYAFRGKGMTYQKIRQPNSRTVWSETDCTDLVKYAASLQCNEIKQANESCF